MGVTHIVRFPAESVVIFTSHCILSCCVVNLRKAESRDGLKNQKRIGLAVWMHTEHITYLFLWQNYLKINMNVFPLKCLGIWGLESFTLLTAIYTDLNITTFFFFFLKQDFLKCCNVSSNRYSLSLFRYYIISHLLYWKTYFVFNMCCGQQFLSDR